MALGSMTPLEEEVAASVRRLRESATLRHRDQVHGFIYDVETGALRQIA